MNYNATEQSLFKSIALHLLPGILGGIGYFAIVPIVKSNGFPSIMALTLAGLFILVPFELGVLFFRKRKSAVNLFKGVINYTKPLNAWQYVAFTSSIFILSGLAFKAFSFTSDVLMPLFQWIPSEMALDMGLSGEYLKSKLIITYSLFLVLTVIVLPSIEELYFRGYLLPRMPLKLKGWTEIIHSGLFALYHTWTPWLFITRTIAVFPLIFIVKRKQNLYIGIIAHCLLNAIDFLIGLVFILNM